MATLRAFRASRHYRLEILDKLRLGSDTMLVAPVEVADDAMTGAGSVISVDVPAGSLAIGRAKQRNLADWAERFRRRKKR